MYMCVGVYVCARLCVRVCVCACMVGVGVYVCVYVYMHVYLLVRARVRVLVVVGVVRVVGACAFMRARPSLGMWIPLSLFHLPLVLSRP